MKLIIDLSKYNWNLTNLQWDILGEICDGVIIRLTYGRTIDSKVQDHIDQCIRVGLPYAGYSWVDPLSDFQGQLNTIISAKQKYNPSAIMLDLEQYWTDWAAYMRQDYATAYATRFTPEQLNTYYKKFFTASKQYVGVTIGCYSSNSFMADYCPAMFDWVPFNNYWRAGYPINDNHYEPEEVRALADTIDLEGCIGRQFSDGLDITGLPAKLDWNAFSEEGFRILFGDETMSINIEMEFISQLGPGAGMHNNDCGPACCSMIINKAKDTFVSPDQLYKLPGWGAPSTDVGTNAWQLQAALHLFDVDSNIGNSLTISTIKDFIDRGYPLITLVKYGLFSDAGLTIKKGTFNHWLIVTGYTDTEIITLDPYRPFENGGIMKVPYQMFTNSYLGYYLQCVLTKTEVEVFNATVNNFLGLNIRGSLPISKYVLGTDIGDLIHLQKIRLKEPVLDYIGLDGLTWVELELPMVGWVAKKYLIIDPITIPPTFDEKVIRRDELQKIEAFMQEYFAKRRDEINL